MFRAKLLSLLCLLCLCCSWVQCYDAYTVPRARIEVFRPRGLRISIPDYHGVRLFAVHAVINRDLNGLEAGDISKDVLRKTGDRWVFEDNKLQLNYGDVLNYWLFVINGNLGYRLDDQKYTVHHILEAPEDFSLSNRTPTGKTTISPFFEPQYFPATPPTCTCLPPNIPMCVHPNPPTTSTTPPPAPSTSVRPAAAPTASQADILIWRELIVNLSNENADFRNQIAVLHENNQLLVTKLQKLGDENLTKLRLEGKISQDDSPTSIVKTVLIEKLRILDTNILKSAVKNSDGSITFELQSVDDKLRVLRAAKEKLISGKFTIKDIDAVSFMNLETGKVTIDMRHP